MYELCSQKKSSPFSDCLKQRLSAMTLLRQYIYQSVSTDPEILFECRQQCVFDYLHTT